MLTRRALAAVEGSRSSYSVESARVKEGRHLRGGKRISDILAAKTERRKDGRDMGERKNVQ